MSGKVPKRIQSSYLKLKIAACGEEIAQLQQILCNVDDENKYLRAKLDALNNGVASANERFSYCVALRCALSRHSLGVAREQQRNTMSIVALPPPEEWGLEIAARFNAMGPQECRYMLRDGYQNMGRLLNEALHNPDLRVELEAHCHKTQKFICHFMQSGKCAWWSKMVTCNLQTGEEGTPDEWYDEVADSVPEDFLTPTQLSALYKGLQRLTASLRDVATQHRKLTQQLSELLRVNSTTIMDVQAQILPMQHFTQTQLREASQSLRRHASACIPGDDFSKMDRILEEMEDSVVKGNRARMTFLMYVFQQLSVIQISYLATASSRYFVQAPLLFTAVVRAALRKRMQRQQPHLQVL